MNQQPPNVGELATWLAIVTQLYSTRMNRLMSQHQFTSTQFSVLSHLARHSDQQHTVSSLTEAVEVNQPGVTKIVKKLGGMGLLESVRDSADSRKKYISITSAGLRMIETVQHSLAPDVNAWFADWSDDDRQTFLILLRKLGIWLDENRLA